MNSEAVLSLGLTTKKRRISVTDNLVNISSTCFLCKKECVETHDYDETQWDALKSTAKSWMGLDKYGHVFSNTDWAKGPKDDQKIFHRKCTNYMQTKKTLEQAQKHKKKKEGPVASTSTPCSSKNSNDAISASSEFFTTSSISEDQDQILESSSPPAPPNRDQHLKSPPSTKATRSFHATFTTPPPATRASSGTIFDKSLCIWCRKPDEFFKKKKAKIDNPWYRVEQKKSWRRICACTPFLEDQDMRKRLLAIIAMFPKDDCFFADIHYHKKCWDRYVSHLIPDTRRRREHSLQKVSTNEVNAVFIDHVERTICTLKEPRTLQGLLEDYHNIVFDLRGESKVFKTSYIRILISEEFGNQISFHDRHQKNASTFVYDSSEGGIFLECAVNSWGLPIEELLQNVAQRINENAKDLPEMHWPPSIDSLTTQTPDNFLTQFVGWLISPEKKQVDLTPESYAIASILQALVTGKRTSFQVLWTSMIYGLSRSKELVDLSKRFGFGVSYQDIKNLLASWAKQEIENEICPPEITEDYPAVVVMDNDDFKTDTLTGASETNHRTNVMFIQNESLIDRASSTEETPALIRPKDLRAVVEELNKVTPYKTTKTDLPLRKKFPLKPSDTKDMRAEQMIHTLVRIDGDGGSIPPDEQKIGSFAGFQALLESEVSKSKPYYWLTFPRPPHKSVTHQIMMRLLEVIDKKNLPFVLLTGDQPVYTLIVQLRSEGNGKFKKIIPILGPFHTQVAFITAITKRFEGSGLSDIFVSAGIIADKSVDQAMRGKHFRRIVRALQLMYEALQRRIIQKGLENGVEYPHDVESQINKLRQQHYNDPNILHQCIKQAPDFRLFVEKCYANIEKTPMAEYWFSFMEMVEILIMNIHATKVKDFDLFKISLRLMIPWLQVYDKLHYGKWLADFWSEMVNLSEV